MAIQVKLGNMGTQCVGFYSHVNVGSSDPSYKRFGTVQLINCQVDGDLTQGVGGTDITNFIMIGGWVNCPAANNAIGPGGLVNTISGVTVTNGSRGIEPGVGSSSVTITNCTLNVQGGWNCTAIWLDGANMTVDIEDCMVTQSPGAGTWFIRSRNSGMVIISKNNTVGCDGYLYIMEVGGAPASFTADNNTYPAQGVNARAANWGSGDLTYAQYKTLTGQDSHSTP